MARMSVVERRLDQSQTSRRLERSTIGRGGIRVAGGTVDIQDGGMLRAQYPSGEGGAYFGPLTAEVDGTHTGHGLLIRQDAAVDGSGSNIFRAVSRPSGDRQVHIGSAAEPEHFIEQCSVQALQIWIDTGPGQNIQLYSGNNVQFGTSSQPISNSYFVFANGSVSLGTTSQRIGGRVVLEADEGVQVATPLTTTSAANCTLSNISGGSSGRLQRVTSSLASKKDVEDYLPDPAQVLKLKPRTWRDKSETERDPDTDRWHIGLVAEEAATCAPELVDYDADENPTSVTYDRLPIALLRVIQLQEQRITALENRLKIKPDEPECTAPKPPRCDTVPDDDSEDTCERDHTIR